MCSCIHLDKLSTIQETAAGIVGNLCTFDSYILSLSEKIQRTLPAREPVCGKKTFGYRSVPKEPLNMDYFIKEPTSFGANAGDLGTKSSALCGLPNESK